MDAILPSSPELLFGAMGWLVLVVGSAVLVAADLRRRDVAAWWVAAALTLVVYPFGIVAYVVLRTVRTPRTRPDR